MLVKLYDRGPEGTVKDKYISGFKESNIGILNIRCEDDCYRIFRYCHNCNSDLYGEWRYKSRYVFWWKYEKRYMLEWIDDDFNALPENDIIWNKNEQSQKQKLESKGLTNEFKYINEYVTDTTSLISNYRVEINNFVNAKNCPICGLKLNTSPNDNFIPCERIFTESYTMDEKGNMFIPSDTNDPRSSLEESYMQSSSEIVFYNDNKTGIRMSQDEVNSFKKAKINERIWLNGKTAIKDSDEHAILYDTNKFSWGTFPQTMLLFQRCQCSYHL